MRTSAAQNSTRCGKQVTMRKNHSSTNVLPQVKEYQCAMENMQATTTSADIMQDHGAVILHTASSRTHIWKLTITRTICYLHRLFRSASTKLDSDRIIALQRHRREHALRLEIVPSSRPHPISTGFPAVGGNAFDVRWHGSAALPSTAFTQNFCECLKITSNPLLPSSKIKLQQPRSLHDLRCRRASSLQSNVQGYHCSSHMPLIGQHLGLHGCSCCGRSPNGYCCTQFKELYTAICMLSSRAAGTEI